LTGKIGKNSFGFLVASDKAPGNYSEEERDDPGIRPRLGEFLESSAISERKTISDFSQPTGVFPNERISWLV